MKKLTYEEKIKAELNRHDQQWEDAVCPDVVKYGKQADEEIQKLEERIDEIETCLRAHEQL